MRRVAIVHPWMPQYRREFFSSLIRLGQAEGISIDVYCGEPPIEWRSRKDSIETPEVSRLPTKFWRVGRQYLMYKSLRPIDLRRYDLIVAEQAVRNLETYLLLLRARGKVAFWGHGRTYTKSVSRVQEKLKMWLTLKGRWFFAYTPGGAQAVIRSGFQVSRITTVFNAIDSTSLAAGVANLAAEEIAGFSARHGLSSKTALYMGGLDTSKRIDFLLLAARMAHKLDPAFHLVIAGSGDHRGLVEKAAADYDWLTYLGPIFGQEKYLAMASAKILMNPGRVGLVAVDSFAAGVPLVTVDWPWHAPEAEYLVDGENARITEDDPEEFARVVVELLNDPSALTVLKNGALSAAKNYTMENMVANFMSGLSAACRSEAAG